MKICSGNWTKILTILAVLAIPAGAFADCYINGSIEAAESADPEMPTYMYTLTLTWDMGSPYGLSHFDLLADLEGGTCSCSDFCQALYFPEISGTSTGEGDCTVEYQAWIECNGDPSIPGVDGIIIKFEPMETPDCEPGNSGMGTFVFYSNLAPQPINEEVIAMVDKAGQESCFGALTGVFPGLECDPVPTLERSLDNLKTLYR